MLLLKKKDLKLYYVLLKILPKLESNKTDEL